jgi:hypothetical protein
MQDRRARDILAESEAAYKGAVTDPATHGPAAEQLVLEASRQRDAEALIVALRALAWARHVRLDNVSARRT